MDSEIQPLKPSDPDVREQFRPIATAYRKVSRISNFVLLPVLVVGIILSISAHKGAYLFAAIIPFILLAIIADGFKPKLLCPACHQLVDNGLNAFCPECGHAPIEGAYWSWNKFHYFWPLCYTCKKRLLYKNGRTFYRIRFCTHCGAHLDDQGI